MSKDKSHIPFNQPYIAGRELDYIARAVIENNRLSGDGPFTRKCQEWLEERLRTYKALLTHSCTSALEMSALLCEIQPGDEVVMPSFTFVSTANAFVLRGAVPVFVDIRQDTLNMDEALLEQAVTSRTKAVVPVHYAGNPCEMSSILGIARDNALWVIEDAAQGHLSTYQEKYLGTIGDIGCLSFHETKNLISGEGGAILINNPDIAQRAEIVWEKGTNRRPFARGEVDKYTWVDIGSSFLPSDMIASFLYAQLEMAESIIADRKESFQLYMQGLKDLEEKGCFRLPGIDDSGTCNGHMMYIITNSLQERIDLASYLQGKDIKALFHYVPLHSSPMGSKYCRTHGELPHTEQISDRLLRLPLFYGMHQGQVERVVQAITEFYLHNPR